MLETCGISRARAYLPDDRVEASSRPTLARRSGRHALMLTVVPDPGGGRDCSGSVSPGRREDRDEEGRRRDDGRGGSGYCDAKSHGRDATDPRRRPGGGRSDNHFVTDRSGHSRAPRAPGPCVSLARRGPCTAGPDLCYSTSFPSVDTSRISAAISSGIGGI